MFTCNNYNLLTFTYYLKLLLFFNMIIIPFIYLYINCIIIIKKKKIVSKYYLKNKLKSSFYIITIFLLSFIIHNMLNNNQSVCYIKATPKIYYEYKTSYNFLVNKELDNDLKNKYLESILSNKENINLESLIYKTETKEVLTDNKIVTNPLDIIQHENDTNIQNKVYIIDGVFYYPNYIYNNYETYSGMHCPSNPENEGYNNPFGYNNYFYNRLSLFIEEAKNNGFKITMSTQGCRTFDTQNYYYNTMTPGRAARPGFSLHGFGIASDLEFYQNDGSICSGYRNESNCPSMGWAHNNAYRFGLTFPLLNASYKEDWHIEPISKNKY